MAGMQCKRLFANKMADAKGQNATNKHNVIQTTSNGRSLYNVSQKTTQL